jgi:hypothetical protein
MPDFNVRSDSVNVEQIMEQIRARIREKRGVDYTEQQIRELAAVKLEKFLDPRGVRSDLLDQFRKAQPAYEPPELPNFAFEDDTLFESHRAPIRWIRTLLLPLLKLLFNPNPLIQALHIQSRLNTINAERNARQDAARRQMDQLYYELVHNLVVETTRTGIEVKNLKMQVESISSRLEFNERRARALESAVVYKTAEADDAAPPRPVPQPPPQRQPPPRQQQSRYTPPQPTYVAPVQIPPPAQTPSPAVVAVPEPQATGQGQPPASGQGVPGEGPGQRSRRRRRRRGRRGGGAAAAVMGAAGASVPGATPDERPAGDVVDQMDALDATDDGSPEAENIHEAAVEPVEQAAETVIRQAESHAADPVVEPVPVEPAGGEPVPVHHEPVRAPRVEAPAPPHVEAAPAAPDASQEPAPVPPATPDGADRDPQ